MSDLPLKPGFYKNLEGWEGVGDEREVSGGRRYMSAYD